MTNVLFVCSANRLRSPTAEQIFSTWPGIETDSAGISNGASVPLSSEQVEWADIIFVMEKTHRTKLNRKFRSSLKDKRVSASTFPMITNSWIPSWSGSSKAGSAVSCPNRDRQCDRGHPGNDEAQSRTVVAMAAQQRV